MSVISELIVERLLVAAHVTEERLSEALEPSGLTVAKALVLDRLARSERPLSLGELGRQLGCAKSNVTQLVDRLEAEGLLQRSSDPGDRRRRLAVLTERGRERLEQAQPLLHAAESSVAERLSNSDRAALVSLLDRLTSA